MIAQVGIDYPRLFTINYPQHRLNALNPFMKINPATGKAYSKDWERDPNLVRSKIRV